MIWFALAMMTLLQGGCVLGRRTVPLVIPAAAAATPAAATRGKICVTTVTDNRAFQNEPPDPSTPSVDGDVATFSAEQRASMIGRQRNGYGKAMGDIALPADDSVIKRARVLVEEGLTRRGYQVTSEPFAPASATVAIDQFWAWGTPGFWSVAFEARVYCTVTMRDGGRSGTFVIKGDGLNRGQMASDENWQQAYRAAFDDFLTKFEAEMAKR
jgi:hypothetical protein